MRTFALCALISVGVAAYGCGGAKPEAAGPSAKGGSPGARTASCERQHPGVGAVRRGTERQGSPVALAQAGSSAIAYVADEDSKALHTVDVDKGTELATTKLGGAPAQAMVLADGRVAVTLRDANEIQVLEPGSTASAPLESLCRIPVPAEPFGLAATPDDKQVLVTSAWDRALTVLDAQTLAKKFGVQVGREPRAVLVDDSGERAFVSHVVGAKMSVIDLTGDKHDVRDIDLRVKKITAFPAGAVEQGKLRGASQGFALAKSVTVDDKEPVGEKPLVKGRAPKTPAPATLPGRIFAPMATVDPGDAAVRSQAYYGESRDGVPKEAPIVSVIDAGAERAMTRGVLSLGTILTQECLLPRAAATRASTGTLFVTCLGVDSLVELDTRGADPMRLERRRWHVPTGPTGVAIDDAKERAVVWSQFEGKLSVIDLRGKADDAAVKIVKVHYEPTPEAAAIAAGRTLFHLTDDRRVSNDGVACASCHPDGREDSFTWSTPEGPRQTIMLAGRATGSAPYGWRGLHGDLKAYLANTFSRLGGTGVQGGELEALISYIEKSPGPKESVDPGRAEMVARGKDLFFAEEQGCASCHMGGLGVDKVTHDIGSMTTADVDPKFDTPSLRFVRGTGPYFHDGRYKTLDDVLAANDTQMGHTSQLTQRDIGALKAYLDSL